MNSPSRKHLHMYCGKLFSKYQNELNTLIITYMVCIMTYDLSVLALCRVNYDFSPLPLYVVTYDLSPLALYIVTYDLSPLALA